MRIMTCKTKKEEGSKGVEAALLENFAFESSVERCFRLLVDLRGTKGQALYMFAPTSRPRLKSAELESRSLGKPQTPH